MKFFPFIIFVFLIISGCDFLDFNDQDHQNGLNIYLVKDGQLDNSEKDIPLENLKLEEFPWVNNEEIELYDWSAHVFYLNKEKEREKYSRRYFLVKSGNDPLFLGYFFPPYLSSLSEFPSVLAADDFLFPNDVIEIGGIFGGYFMDEMDNNTEFKKALKKNHLLKEGIRVDLISAKKISPDILEYTIEVTNLEDGKLYILDPEKMGSSRFHYFTNGITFIQNGNYFSPENFSFTATEEILPEWYYALKPSESIIRTIRLDGYPVMPSGKVTASFHFPGQPEKLKYWKKQDGRIWLGSYHLEKELILE